MKNTKDDIDLNVSKNENLKNYIEKDIEKNLEKENKQFNIDKYKDETKAFMERFFDKVDKSRKEFFIVIMLLSVVVLSCAFIITYLNGNSINASDGYTVSNNKYTMKISIGNNFRYTNDFSMNSPKEISDFKKEDMFKPIVQTEKEIIGQEVGQYIVNAAIPTLNIIKTVEIDNILNEINNLKIKVNSKINKVGSLINDSENKERVNLVYKACAYDNILSIALKYKDNNENILNLYNYDADKNSKTTFNEALVKFGYNFKDIDNIIKKLIKAKDFKMFVENFKYSDKIYDNFFINEDGDIKIFLNYETYINIDLNKN